MQSFLGKTDGVYSCVFYFWSLVSSFGLVSGVEPGTVNGGFQRFDGTIPKLVVRRPPPFFSTS